MPRTVPREAATAPPRNLVVRVQEDQLERLRGIARRENRTVSDQVRHWIDRDPDTSAA